MRYLTPVYSRVRLSDIVSGLGSLRRSVGCRQLDETRLALRSRYPGYQVELTDSGTSALVLALEISSAMAEPRQRTPIVVALPAYACPDVGAAALRAGARIALYDTDPETLEPDWQDVERVLRDGCAALVVTHLFGRIVDLSVAISMAERYGVQIIEDAAQHASGSVNGVRGGGQSALSILSFGRGKGLNAGGGGALLHRGFEIDLRAQVGAASARVRPIIAAGIAEILSSPWLYRFPARAPGLGVGQTQYHDAPPPASLSPTVAPALRFALETEGSAMAARRAREASFRATLADVDAAWGWFPVASPETGALRCPAILSDRSLENIQAVHRLGVVRSYPRTLSEYPELSSIIEDPRGPLPGATELAKRLYTLPTHERVRDEDVRRICDWLSAVR